MCTLFAIVAIHLPWRHLVQFWLFIALGVAALLATFQSNRWTVWYSAVEKSTTSWLLKESGLGPSWTCIVIVELLEPNSTRTIQGCTGPTGACCLEIMIILRIIQCFFLPYIHATCSIVESLGTVTEHDADRQAWCWATPLSRGWVSKTWPSLPWSSWPRSLSTASRRCAESLVWRNMLIFFVQCLVEVGFRVVLGVDAHELQLPLASQFC